MIHTCFVYDHTCFMCIFIQYLAFSGTNLLTRCRSASSCFLLFLYFRKFTYEIFSELDQTKAKVPNIPEDSGGQKDTWRGSARWPDATQARPDPGPCLGGIWAHQGAPDSASSPYNLCIGKTLDTREKIHEKFRSRRHRWTLLGRVLELFPAPCRREKSSPEAFFITMPTSTPMCG